MLRTYPQINIQAHCQSCGIIYTKKTYNHKYCSQCSQAVWIEQKKRRQKEIQQAKKTRQGFSKPITAEKHLWIAIPADEEHFTWFRMNDKVYESKTYPTCKCGRKYVPLPNSKECFFCSFTRT